MEWVEWKGEEDVSGSEGLNLWKGFTCGKGSEALKRGRFTEFMDA